jgi:hypothetical protein
MILGVLLAAMVVLAAAQLGAEPRAQFKVDERFPPRIGEIKILGVEVSSALSDGSVSEADLKSLSVFISDGLRKGSEAGQGSFAAVVDITSGGRAKEADLILSIEITVLEAATPEERKERIPSHLHGTISLVSRATQKKLGTATIWATGLGLDLDSNYQPQTVRTFTATIREIIQ